MTQFIRDRRRTIIGMASILIAVAGAALPASAALVTSFLGTAQGIAVSSYSDFRSAGFRGDSTQPGAVPAAAALGFGFVALQEKINEEASRYQKLKRFTWLV